MFLKIGHTSQLALSYFWYTFLLLTDEYLLRAVLDWKVLGLQANQHHIVTEWSSLEHSWTM